MDAGGMYLSAATSTCRLIKSPAFCRGRCKTPWSSELSSRLHMHSPRHARRRGPALCQASGEQAPSMHWARPQSRGRAAGHAGPPCPAPQVPQELGALPAHCIPPQEGRQGYGVTQWTLPPPQAGPSPPGERTPQRANPA